MEHMVVAVKADQEFGFHLSTLIARYGMWQPQNQTVDNLLRLASDVKAHAQQI